MPGADDAPGFPPMTICALPESETGQEKESVRKSDDDDGGKTWTMEIRNRNSHRTINIGFVILVANVTSL